MSCAHSFVNTAAHEHYKPPLGILAFMGRIETESELGMARERKRAVMQDWQKADAARLSELVANFRAKHGTRGSGNDPGVGSQEWLAAKCGIHQTAVSHYQKGRIALNIPILVKFCRALGATPDQISPTLAEQIWWVRIGEGVYSKAALELAQKIDTIRETEAGRSALFFIERTIATEKAASDRRVETADIEFVAPNSPLRLKLEREAKVKRLRPPGKLLDGLDEDA